MTYFIIKKTYKIIILLLLFFVIISLISCSSTIREFVVRPDYEKKFNKTLIVKPYKPATEKDRVYVYFGIVEFSKKDEDAFYNTVINSLKESDFFIDVVVTDSWEEAKYTEGNIYLGIYNNIASIWSDEKNDWYGHFRTTISFEVKNIVYFGKTYDVLEKDVISPRNLKEKVFRRILEELFNDLEEQDLERP